MRKYFAWFLTKHLFRWVSEEDILSFKVSPSGKVEGIFHKGKPLEAEEIYRLSDQAKSIRQSYLWKVLSDEIRYTAYRMFVASKDYDETLSARLLLRSQEIIQKRVDALAALGKTEPRA
ncbi:MAG TPA: hypothetical protein VJ043_03250 [Candidatus Paceibacterota bacterium]|nr:hypothetical protein [Candidatus Paceibacterota bacterium]